MIQLEYGDNSRYCATIVLPDASVPIDDFIQSLSLSDWEKWRYLILPPSRIHSHT